MTHYKNLASAAAVDGAHVRGLLASNHAAAEAAREIKRWAAFISETFTLHECESGAIWFLTEHGFIAGGVNRYWQSFTDCNIPAAAFGIAASAYADRKAARAAARLAAAAMLDTVLTGTAEEKAAYAASPACAEMRRRTAAGAYGEQLAAEVRALEHRALEASA